MQKTSDFIKSGLKSKPCAEEQSQAVFTWFFECSGFAGRFIGSHRFPIDCNTAAIPGSRKCIDEGTMFCGGIRLTTFNQAVQDTTQCR
jgi:hypothetical protein